MLHRMLRLSNNLTLCSPDEVSRLSIENYNRHSASFMSGLFAGHTRSTLTCTGWAWSCSLHLVSLSSLDRLCTYTSICIFSGFYGLGLQRLTLQCVASSLSPSSPCGTCRSPFPPGCVHAHANWLTPLSSPSPSLPPPLPVAFYSDKQGPYRDAPCDLTDCLEAFVAKEVWGTDPYSLTLRRLWMGTKKPGARAAARCGPAPSSCESSGRRVFSCFT